MNKEREQAVGIGREGRGGRRGTRALGGTTGRRTTKNCREKQIRGSPPPDLQMPQLKQQPPHTRHGGRYAYEATLLAGQTMLDFDKSVYLMNALTDQKKEKVAILMGDRDTWAALQDAMKSLFRVEALSGKTKNPAVIGNTSDFS
uniref:Uncharacterized protein n=1 Tax=Chromera velia CCMP2878 TaxID=1169474 RepID=A0A0G4FAF7_9ALVE|eukprot:Cvel_15886.t1-p1 / transcript=Cvel_15886.t1 / gene=Cvel_15886 / organism=Chromera_velia_CCMP2878 / gene_product=hypothetical protein / transcript_product=hypothetical protein / location=Cvel_scaffold1199:20581-37962(-) / protein_length=144 / sequence_SO=supercontig / SO=protein_coding / is_pseudo=false